MHVRAGGMIKRTNRPPKRDRRGTLAAAVRQANKLVLFLDEDGFDDEARDSRWLGREIGHDGHHFPWELLRLQSNRQLLGLDITRFLESIESKDILVINV